MRGDSRLLLPSPRRIADRERLHAPREDSADRGGGSHARSTHAARLAAGGGEEVERINNTPLRSRTQTRNTRTGKNNGAKM